MPDWGGAYDEQVRLEARLLRQQREGCISSGASRHVYVGTSIYEVGRMSDEQIAEMFVAKVGRKPHEKASRDTRITKIKEAMEAEARGA